MPDDFSDYIIPAAACFHARESWGILCFQEVESSNYLIQHFLFSLKQSISFFNEDGNNKIQSLLTIDGSFGFQINGQTKIELKEKEFLSFIAAGRVSLITAHSGLSSILNAYYTTDLYHHLVPCFIGLKQDLQKAIKKPIISFSLKIEQETLYMMLSK